MSTYMTTYTKKRIFPMQLTKEDINIKDIAHALSLMCRANGHIKYFYSVAQHSINCAQEAMHRGYAKKVIKACLLHDASEAYLSDIIRPVKQHLDTYLVIEDSIQTLIYNKFGIEDLDEKEKQQVKQIDDDMLYNELFTLMDEKIVDVIPTLSEDVDLTYHEFEDVEREFLLLFAM
ncbi:MAG: phosphohydrolase [Coprobacillaceae bacterium]